MMRNSVVPRVEWPTVAMLVFCYGAWGLTTWSLSGAFGWILWPVTVLLITLHASLQHEATHGHPTGREEIDAALVFPALGLFLPFARFRAQHRAHHATDALTDPVLDTESFYVTPEAWARTGRFQRLVLCANNTLIGRLVLGPAIDLVRFYRNEARALLNGDRAVARAWFWHLPAVALVLAWTMLVCDIPLASYAAAAYAAYGLLMLRTFAEHRAHPDVAARSVVIEQRGLLALLFLNNNLHAVHHRHPRAPWYALPRLYARARPGILARNGGYRYDGYAALFRRFAFRPKEPVCHPTPEARHG